MSFIETPRFPDKISYGSSGGPMYNTDIVTVKSGYETRNQNWVQSRHEYDASFGVTTEDRLSELVDFFHAMAGQAHEFRFKDWADYKSCSLTEEPSQTDQVLGVGDALGTDTFQIIKTYTAGILSRVRDISKPIEGTLLVEVDGVLLVEALDYTVDYTTGLITFLGGSIPNDGVGARCGYQFDVPCRFGSDALNINLNAYAIGETTVPLIEVRI